MKEQLNTNTSNQEKPKASAFERLTRNLKKKILIGALSIASIVGAEQYIGKYTEYNSTKTFNEAFKKAHAKGEHTFYWNGKRYAVRLVDKEFSKTYWESKKFLTEYYSSDYFKNKHTYIPGWHDFEEAQSFLREKAYNNPILKYLSDKIDKKIDITDAEWQEYLKLSEEVDRVSSPEYRNSPEYKELVSSMAAEKSKVKIEKAISTRIDNLKTPTYFSITDQKDGMSEDGSYKTKDGRVFIYQKNHENLETTSIHELTHKSTKGETGMEGMDWANLLTRAQESVKKNHLEGQHYEKWGSGWIDYVTNPTEIDARQNSTRFWLFKHFPGYRADTVFTQQHYDFLQENLEKLPYDIRQLLDLFPEREAFIENMNKY